MRNKKEWIDEYLKDFNEIHTSVEGEFMSREQIHRKIAKKWNVAYSIINELYEDSKELENNNLGKIDLFRKEMSRLLNKYNAELSVSNDDNHTIEVYFNGTGLEYSLCDNVISNKFESITSKDLCSNGTKR